MQTVWARQGQPVLLKCPIHVNESDNYALEWRREGSLIFNAFGNETGHTTPSMQVYDFSKVVLTNQCI
ncbi:hypothetical protein M3Y95_00058300 [Aphelenchoides besseyi]|nr:hypothetical protein M3Y95_00058300 [Aphelenchoides besseyi]